MARAAARAGVRVVVLTDHGDATRARRSARLRRRRAGARRGRDQYVGRPLRRPRRDPGPVSAGRRAASRGRGRRPARRTGPGRASRLVAARPALARLGRAVRWTGVAQRRQRMARPAGTAVANGAGVSLAPGRGAGQPGRSAGLRARAMGSTDRPAAGRRPRRARRPRPARRRRGGGAVRGMGGARPAVLHRDVRQLRDLRAAGEPAERRRRCRCRGARRRAARRTQLQRGDRHRADRPADVRGRERRPARDDGGAAGAARSGARPPRRRRASRRARAADLRRGGRGRGAGRPAGLDIQRRAGRLPGRSRRWRAAAGDSRGW